jgi:large subunit ribosomal protein L10
MPTQAKRETVAELTALLAASSSSIVADYRGLTVAQIGAVRRVLREKGIGYHVVKNRLARIAAEQAGIGELSPLLVGPSALALGGGIDESGLARAFLDAIRPYKTVYVRGAVIRGHSVAAADVTRLAELPGRDVLLAQLAGAFASPLGTMAGLLSAPIRNLAGGLAQLLEQRATVGEI